MAGRSDEEKDRGAEFLARWQQDGDVEALDQLLRLEIGALRARVRSKGRRMALSPGSSSDVVNEAVLRVLKAEALPRFENMRVFSAYLWRAAYRLLLDRLRHRRPDLLADQSSRVMEAALATSGGLSAVDRSDEREQVALAMSLMPAELRAALDMKYTRHLDTAAIAAELGITEDAARMRLVRAKKKLTEKLKGWRDLIGR